MNKSSGRRPLPQSGAPSKKERGPSALPLPIRGTRYLVGGLLVAIIVAVVSATYLRIESQLEKTLERQLGTVVDEKVHAITRFLHNRDALAQAATRFHSVLEIADALIEGTLDDAAVQEELGRALHPLLETKMASSIYYTTPDGLKLLVSGQPNRPLLPHQSEDRAIFLESLDGSFQIGSSFSIVDRGVEKGTLQFFTSAEEMDQALQVAGQGGEYDAYAFDAEGKILGKNAEKLTSQVTFELPVSKMLPGEPPGQPRKVFEYVGRKGAPVVGTWTWIPAYQIGIATEIPQSKAYDSLTRLRRSFLVLVTLVGAALLGFLALGRWTLRVREESLLMTRRLDRLARAIQPLSAALEHDPSAVVLVDSEGQVVYANAASHRVLGVSASLYGQEVDAVFENLPFELQAALDSGRDSIVAKGTGAEDETLLVSSRDLTIDGNPHALYMLRPITQQVRRQEVEHWKKLIRVLSHELNNALAPITSLLSSAKKVNQMTHQDPRLGKIFEDIAERTGHLISFIEGYREVARLPRPDQKEMSWSSFLDGLSSQKKFRLIGGVPARHGYFDPSQLERVLINVFNNAIEADSPPEDVTLEVVDEKTGFRIDVMDRGAGMPEPVLKQAMLPFFSTKRTGTGVGLALSREIIEAHGGQLTLANRDGGGLVVSCYLPNPPSPAVRPSVSKMMAAPRNTDETPT